MTREQFLHAIKNNTFPSDNCYPRAKILRDSDPKNMLWCWDHLASDNPMAVFIENMVKFVEKIEQYLVVSNSTVELSK